MILKPYSVYRRINHIPLHDNLLRILEMRADISKLKVQIVVEMNEYEKVYSE